jgi:hypothetical protein
MDYTKKGKVEHEWKDPREDLVRCCGKSLSIWHLGNPANTALPLAIELEDRDGKKDRAYHPDPDVALNGDWSEWNLELTAEFPSVVKWHEMKKMKIEMRERSGYEDGGTMIFDDIRIYPCRCIAEYGPAADFTGDCKVYYEDLAVMVNEWTLTEDEGDLWSGAWSDAEIGNEDPNGSFTDHNDGTYTMTANGHDIWDNADDFHYAYQQMSGDGQMIIRCTSLVWTNDWAKAGIMMRQDLDPNSAHGYMAVTTSNGVAMQGRDVKGGGCFNLQHSGRSVPMCLKLVRVGDTFTGYFYEDGVWKMAGSRVIPMTDPIHVGMAVTSHTTGVLTTATFDRACISSTVDLNEDGAVNFVDYAQLMEQWLVEILWPDCECLD